MLLGIVALVAGALLPLWRIQLVAPQYQEGLTLEMYTHKIAAGNGGQDLAEINTLNHYIGMKSIAQADFAEMTWMPFAIGVFALLALRAVVMGRIGNLVDLGVLFVYFGAFSMGTFAYRLWSYGHHLDPHAPMRDRAVHAGGHRQPADRQLRPDQPADGRHRADGPVPRRHRRRDLVLAEGGAVTTHARLLVLSAALSAAALGRLAAGAAEPADGGAELRARIAAAAPGATIHVAAGRYTGRS